MGRTSKNQAHPAELLEKRAPPANSVGVMRPWEQVRDLGRPPIYRDAEQLRDRLIEYFRWVEDNPVFTPSGPVPRPMLLREMAHFCGVTHSHWCWLRRNREDLSDVISWAEEVVHDQKLAGAMVGMYNSNIVARELGVGDRKFEEKPAIERIEVTFIDAEPGRSPAEATETREK